MDLGDFELLPVASPMVATLNPVFFDVLENYHVNGMEEIFI